MLERVFELREPIKEFIGSKEQPVNMFNDPIWVSDLGFLADITMHFNIFNKKMQPPENLINNLFDCVKSFESKLDLWQNQLKDFDLTHFQNVSQCEGYDMNTYVAALAKLKGELSFRFTDFRTSDTSIDLFARPFSVKVKDVSGNMHMELTDLQNNTELKENYSLGLITCF